MGNLLKECGVQPKKKDLLNFVRNNDDLQRVAKDDVAMYIHLTLAMLYADDINEVCQKHNLVMGAVKHQYKKLDKSLKEYDQVFREVVEAGEEYNFVEGYFKIQDPVAEFVDDNADLFAHLFKELHKLVDDYVQKNVENSSKDIEERIDEVTK